MADTDSGGQESLPCSSCHTYRNPLCPWGFLSVLLPTLLLQCVVILGGSRSGGSCSPAQYHQAPLSSQTLEQPPSPPQECDTLSARCLQADVQTRLMCNCRDRFTAWCFASLGTENLRFVPVGWRHHCPLLGGVSGFEILF